MKKVITSFVNRVNKKEQRALLSGGAVFTYLATSKETDGKFTIFEAKGIPGMEPPPHTHTNEDETFYILEGKLLFTIGDEEILAEEGDFVFMPKNIRHKFKILTTSFRSLVSIYPAGLEDYFEPLSVPYTLDGIPPLNTDPPPQESVEMMKILDKKFGITYHH